MGDFSPIVSPERLVGTVGAAGRVGADRIGEREVAVVGIGGAEIRFALHETIRSGGE